jgi:hypothetical protein
MKKISTVRVNGNMIFKGAVESEEIAACRQQLR